MFVFGAGLKKGIMSRRVSGYQRVSRRWGFGLFVGDGHSDLGAPVPATESFHERKRLWRGASRPSCSGNQGCCTPGGYMQLGINNVTFDH